MLLIDDLWMQTVYDISFGSEDLPTPREQTLASVYLVLSIEWVIIFPCVYIYLISLLIVSYAFIQCSYSPLFGLSAVVFVCRSLHVLRL